MRLLAILLLTSMAFAQYVERSKKDVVVVSETIKKLDDGNFLVTKVKTVTTKKWINKDALIEDIKQKKAAFEAVKSIEDIIAVTTDNATVIEKTEIGFVEDIQIKTAINNK